jgi:head-tail adaptor
MAMQRNAGRLRDLLNFQRRSLGDDGFGNTVPSGDFETQFQAYAGLEPRTGGEEVTAARLAGRQPFVCLVRHSSEMLDVTVGWQAVDARNQNRVFNIASPPADPDGKRQWLEFLVVQGRGS